MPQLWSSPVPDTTSIDWARRKWSLDFKEKNKFENCLKALIPLQIPVAFLEGYKLLNKQVQSLPWPKSPKLIFTSNALWHDTVSMIYTAENVERGSKLIYGQHGGYALPKFMWGEQHEIKISDKYLTWGWTEKNNSNVIPVGILKPINKYKLSKNKLPCK